VKDRFPAALEMAPCGLPEDYLLSWLLLAKRSFRKASVLLATAAFQSRNHRPSGSNREKGRMTRRTNQIGSVSVCALNGSSRQPTWSWQGKTGLRQRCLQELLIDKVSVGGNAQRGNREKIVTILLQSMANSAYRA